MNEQGQPMTVKRSGFYMPVSEEILMDEGLIPDTRPPVHYPWRTRLRWRVRDAVDALRLRVGARIAGVDVRDWEEYSP